MNLYHEHKEITDGQKTIEVIFSDENGLKIRRILNIPYDSDGNVNESYWNEIIEGQKRGILHKYQLGILQFGTYEESKEYTPPEN